MMFFSGMKQFAAWLTWGVMTMSLLTGCGRKAPLYIPTQAQTEQMKKDQAERDAVLKARAERQKQQSQTKLDPKDEQETNNEQETP